ncbi:hypothetical protein JCM19233_120 [Vibrio astriarenae]|nr:hypothetical protein JCM19233_120 [Vibrio sp. C7]
MRLCKNRLDFLLRFPDLYQLDTWLSDFDEGLVSPPNGFTADDITFLRQFDNVAQLNDQYFNEELLFDLMGVLEASINARHCFKAVVIELLGHYFMSSKKMAPKIKAVAHSSPWFKTHQLIEKVDRLRQVGRFDLYAAMEDSNRES